MRPISLPVSRRAAAWRTRSSDVEQPKQPGDERRRVAQRDADDVRGQPELRVEHRLQHVDRVAAGPARQCAISSVAKPAIGGDDVADAEPIDQLRAPGPTARLPQPMKTADEYRFVTGGRPEM